MSQVPNGKRIIASDIGKGGKQAVQLVRFPFVCWYRPGFPFVYILYLCASHGHQRRRLNKDGRTEMIIISTKPAQAFAEFSGQFLFIYF